MKKLDIPFLAFSIMAAAGSTTRTTTCAFTIPAQQQHQHHLAIRTTNTAWNTPSLLSPSQQPQFSRNLPILNSAKILPIAYTSASAALLYRATKVVGADKADAAVLIAASALALVNLGPTDNARLASAKKAYKNTEPASSGIAKQRRQSALTWRSVVRIKLVGQLIGLIWMSAFGIMRGAAVVMATNMAFFLCGAGDAMHDDDGNPAPMPPSVSRAVLIIDSILCFAALLAASSPIGSTRRAISAGIFSAGAFVGAMEGIPKFISGFTTSK